MIFVAICRKTHVLFTLFVFISHSGVQRILTMQVTWRVSYKSQELLAFAGALAHPLIFLWVRVADLCSFSMSCMVCLTSFILCLLYEMLSVSHDCPFLIAPSVFLMFIYTTLYCIALFRHKPWSIRRHFSLHIIFYLI